MKSPHRNLTWLVTGALALLTALPAGAEDTVADMQLFAPADVTSYGGGPEPNTGYFFAFDGIFWSIQRPGTALIGSPAADAVYFTDTSRLWIQTSTVNTGEYDSMITEGSRFQLGRMGEEHGWLGEFYFLQTQEQELHASHVHMRLNDPGIGTSVPMLSGIGALITGTVAPAPQPLWVTNVTPQPGLPTSGPGTPTPPGNVVQPVILPLPLIFWNLTAENKVDTWNTELMYVRRFKPLHHGGVVELMFGARYMEFNEQFNVTTHPAPPLPNTVPNVLHPATETLRPRLPGEAGESILADSFWNTEVGNHIIGPQMAARWHRQFHRLKVSAEGRFCAGLNMQNIQQSGELGSDLMPGVPVINQVPAAGQVAPVMQPYIFPPIGFRHVAFLSEFTPIVEVRGELSYQLTRAVWARFAWNAIWMDGIGRPSSIVNYTLPTLGLNLANNRQDVLLTGFNIGIVVNR